MNISLISLGIGFAGKTRDVLDWRSEMLTVIGSFTKVPVDMRKRLASLVLLLVLVGGAFAGVPLSFGESNCSMGGSMDMECCRAMLLLESREKFTQQEELLCALNCAQNGTTLPVSGVGVNPPAQTIQPLPVTLTQTLSSPFSLPVANARINSPPGSPPTYLRNLALLI